MSRLNAVLGAVGAELLHEFVVDAEEQEGWRPLADEERVFVAAGDLQRERSGDGAEREPEEGVGWQLGGLFFDRFCEETFAMIKVGARGRCIHSAGVTRPPRVRLR